MDILGYREIVNQVLLDIDMHSDDAEELVIRTVRTESGGFKSLVQIGGGPAIGFPQLEPATVRDIWFNYVLYRGHIRDYLISIGFDIDNLEFCVKSSLAIQIVFCRLKYRMDSKPIPCKTDHMGQAEYWKRVYNTPLGKGTVEKFLRDNGLQK